MRNYHNVSTTLLVSMVAALIDAGFSATVRIFDACDEATTGTSYLTTNASNQAIMTAWRNCR